MLFSKEFEEYKSQRKLIATIIYYMKVTAAIDEKFQVQVYKSEYVLIAGLWIEISRKSVKANEIFNI